MSKKTLEGIEHYKLITSNKNYEGYVTEPLEPPAEGQVKGKILRKADPVSGGYKFCYIMEGGAKVQSEQDITVKGVWVDDIVDFSLWRLFTVQVIYPRN